MSVSALEKELVKVTGVKAAKYEDRQDFLAAIVKAVLKLSKDEYDTISDEADVWHHKAVSAMKAEDVIPDFEAAEVAADDDAEDAGEDDESGDVADDDADADETSDPEDAEASDDDDTTDAEAESENEAKEAAAAKKAKGKKAAKPEKTEKVAKKTLEKVKKAAVVKKDKPKGNPKNDVDYESISGEKDKFGVTKDTMTHRAILMYEKGATAGEIKEALGGRYYNILKKLESDGHTVTKDPETGAWKLTHKDDKKAPAKAKPKGK